VARSDKIANSRLLALASIDAARLLWKKHDELRADEMRWGELLDTGKTLARAADFVLRTAPNVAKPEEFEEEI